MSFVELQKQKDSLLRKWTTAGNEVTAVYAIGAALKTDPTKLDQFKGRFAILDRFYSRFENLTDDLLDLNAEFSAIDPATLLAGQVPTEFPIEAQKKFRNNVRACFMDCQELHAKFCVVESTPIQNITLQNATLQAAEGAGVGGANAFLPRTPVPKFSGLYQDWVPFKDMYCSMIHTNPNLSNVQKFHQLVNSISGDAKSVIAGVPISDAMYETAWESLTNTYDNKRVLAAVYMQKLLNFTPIKGATPESLKMFLSQISDTIASIKLLQIPNALDFVLFSLAIRNLPQNVREEFEFKLKPDEFPSTTELSTFVRQRQLSIQLANPTQNFTPDGPKSEDKGAGSKAKTKPRGSSDVKGHEKTSLMTNSAGKAEKLRAPESSRQKSVPKSCPACTESHSLFHCIAFNNMKPRERYESLKGWKGCNICLLPSHSTDICESTRLCRLCKSKHHAMLCFKTPPSNPQGENKSTGAGANLFGATLNSNSTEPTESQVVLATALVNFRDARGMFQQLRVVLDSASQYSYLTQKALNRLGLKVVKTPKKISCLGGMLYDSAIGTADCELRSADNGTVYTAEMVVVRNITSFLPTLEIPTKIRHKYLNFELADPYFYKPGPVDALLGADLFAEVVDGTFHSVGDNIPKLLQTVFGFVVMGKYEPKKSPNTGTSLFSLSTCEDNVCFDLRKFWEVEDVPPSGLLASQADDAAERTFVQQHSRLPDGRFSVRLPFASAVPDLTASEQLARKRFYNLEAKLQRDPSLKEAYVQFMDEYARLAHMEHAQGPSHYVIPHFPVFGKGQKLRVVFDGSSKTPHGSLNQHLLVGPALQNDIRLILVNFRIHQIAFVADAVKMYRQIDVSPLDRSYQHIFWRSDPSQPLQKYQLNTVTYGLSCSPFLALRCVKQLEIENRSNFSLAAKVLSRDLYVDDITTGSDTVSGALELQRQIVQVMQKGKFQLAKWASNSPEVLEEIPLTDRQSAPVDMSDPESNSLKVLGLKWEPTPDVFSYTVKPREDCPSTKRGILSTISRLWDPVGFLAPSTVLFKILIQKLWLALVQWDEKIPSELETQWQDLLRGLAALSQLRIPRCVTPVGPFQYQLVGFADASQEAYCAVIYIRVIKGDHISVRLLTAKTKVAPTKTITVPKLELCGALLLARLLSSMNTFVETMENEQLPSVCFTDSTITLSWIKQIPTNKLKVFVANRVAQIQQLTPAECWRHVAGPDNPSDVGSRGIMPDQLMHHPLWWTGPHWLSQPTACWPNSPINPPEDIPEIKSGSEIPVNFLSCSSLPELINWMGRFSSYRRLIRVTALILRVIHNHKVKPCKRTGAYILLEIVQAFYACVRLVQSYHFFHGDEGKNMSKIETKYKSLSPYLDEAGILRVGGRLSKANISEDQRHQILLPHNSKFTLLLIQFYHNAYLHPGPSLLLALVQKRVWVPGLRRLVRTVTRKCLRCFKSRADTVIPRMGDLPSYRVNGGRAFLHTGVDFAGPFIMKESNRRKAATSKVYLCVFVCMTTKALHLEAVTSLSTEAFIATLTRFIARRGCPSHLYSDNGGNFQGATRELQYLKEWFQKERTQDDILNFCTPPEITWLFNPPYSPHFGGLWESGVRSVKRHLYLASGDTPLTFEELSTLFCEIEAVLNSRPLCPLSDDPDESDFLSPGHFLIGAPLVSYPEPTLLDVRVNTLSRWQLIKRMREQVWARWRLEYLSTLQKRVKWHRSGTEMIQPGDLVLIKSKDAPPFSWPTAKVLQVHPGHDGENRVVTLKSPTGTYRRTVANLIPLVPTKDDEQDGDIIPPE